MSTDGKGHLSKEELAAGVVDENDLGLKARSHLKQCPECRDERQRLADRLHLLGRQACTYVPVPSKRVVLPAEPVRSPWLTGWHPALSAAAGLALVVLVVSWVFSAWFYPGIREERIVREMVRDETLIAEISMLEENALPEAYGDIFPESEPDLDDEILDFIVPIGEV